MGKVTSLQAPRDPLANQGNLTFFKYFLNKGGKKNPKLVPSRAPWHFRLLFCFINKQNRRQGQFVKDPFVKGFSPRTERPVLEGCVPPQGPREQSQLRCPPPTHSGTCIPPAAVPALCGPPGSKAQLCSWAWGALINEQN